MIKKFEYGDLDTYSLEIDKLVQEKMAALDDYEKDSEPYNLIKDEIKQLKGDSSILKDVKKSISKNIFVEIDGWYTPHFVCR